MIRNLAASVQAFTSNVFLVDGDRTVLVDPGANFDVLAALDAAMDGPDPNVGRMDRIDPDEGRMDGLVRDEAAMDGLDAVVLTHTHPDHVENTRAVTEAFDVESWGFDTGHPAIDNEIADGSTVRIGDHDYEALHTPGHKNDHLCFYAPDPGILFAGDLVFQNGGFGRTDLAEGDRERLVESIERVRERVAGNLSAMYCGHGPSVESDPLSHVEMALRAARL